MDGKKTIRKYIYTKKWMLITGIVLAVLALIAGLGGYFLGFYMNRKDAAYFNPFKAEKDTQGYLDIVGISDWIYRDSNSTYYFVAMDNDENLYVVAMPLSDGREMKDQIKYFEAQMSDKEMQMPEAKRIYGTVRAIPSSAKSHVIKSFNGLTSANFSDYFGNSCLNTKSAKGTQALTFGALAAFLLTIFSMVFLLQCLTIALRGEKYLKALEGQNLLDRAAEQLNAPGNMEIGKDCARLSSDFLYGRGSGVVLPLRDIVWCYQRTTRRNGIVVDNALIVFTLNKKRISAYSIGRSDPNEEIHKSMAKIYEANPNVLLGYTHENSRAYSALRKQK